MPRSLTSGMITQLTSGSVRPCYFVEIVFSDETVYIWSGLGPITWNSNTWTGVGNLGQIAAVPETTDVAAENITLLLSGIPSGLLGEIISKVSQTSQVYIWFGFLDSSNNVIADPTQVFAGHLDVPTVTDGADTCAISITAENPLVDLGRAPARRFTDADQQLDFPGDLGFSFVTALQNQDLQWPAVATASSPWRVKSVITPQNTSIKIGTTQQYTLTAYFTDGSTSNQTALVVWSSSNPEIVSMTSGGLAKGISEGQASIISCGTLGLGTSTSLIVTS